MPNYQQFISHQPDRESELLQLRSILDNIDRGFMTVDSNWCITYVNAKAANDVKRRIDELLGKNLWAEFPNLKGTNTEKMFRKAMDEKVAVEFEGSGILTGCWNQQKAFPAVNGIVIAWADLTERKKTEEALEQAKNRLQDILNGIVDGVTLVGLDGKVLDFNESSLKLLGFTHEEFAGTNVYDAIVDEDRQQAINGAFEVLKKGRVVNEVRVKRKNKPPFWAEISVTALCDKNGKPTLFLGVTRDITKRKKLENALRLSEEKFSKAFLNSPFAVSLTCLDDGKIIEANDSAASLFGYNRQEVIGRTTIELNMWAKPEERDKFIQELASSGVVRNREISFCKRDGTVFLVLLSASLIEIQGEKHFLSTFFDITERKKAEEALKQRTEQLEQSQIKLEKSAVKIEEYANHMEEIAEERAKQLEDVKRLAAIGQTAGMVGHDIRNPLQAITSDLYLIKEESKDLESDNKSAILESVESIEENVAYVNKIVSDLQNYTRPLNPTIKQVKIRDLAENVVSTVNIPSRIQAYIGIKAELTINTDHDYLRRIITNLVTNAVQAMPNEGSLTVTAKKIHNKAVISVEDTGVGIPHNVREKLFTPLFTTKSKGQGLGLAVVKRLVEGLNGAVKVESEEGKGTKFIVELPII